MRIAFDLDETLGTAITDSYSIVGFNVRKGCHDILQYLKKRHSLILWSVSNRSYVDKALRLSGLTEYFIEIYSWDDIKCDWKDIRRINADYLIDDSEYYGEKALKNGLGSKYIIIPIYGSVEDQKDPLLWTKQIRKEIK